MGAAARSSLKDFLPHAKRAARNHCVLGQTCGRRAPNPVFHNVFVEDVKSKRILKSEISFIPHVTSSTKTSRNTRLGARLPDVFPENTVTSARSLRLRQDPPRTNLRATARVFARGLRRIVTEVIGLDREIIMFSGKTSGRRAANRVYSQRLRGKRAKMKTEALGFPSF